MRITFDPAKRAKPLAGRGLDFADAAAVFTGLTATEDDRRRDYGEVRRITAGYRRGRFVIVVWTQRGDAATSLRRRFDPLHGELLMGALDALASVVAAMQEDGGALHPTPPRRRLRSTSTAASTKILACCRCPSKPAASPRRE